MMPEEALFDDGATQAATFVTEDWNEYGTKRDGLTMGVITQQQS